ncbi:hypothetical protein TNIN_244971 [Trichonephila inaurata madagascariensis]|uniref:Uncharacterized protein n=1 Tax=Trichonephila inaurata madagascariensis TaxID=2747483 RepID=A0A8X7CD57_9ARAC|nr:hypothetical protein TNIN_244971 [Trichonephila inaurata madagascariensis]
MPLLFLLLPCSTLSRSEKSSWIVLVANAPSKDLERVTQFRPGESGMPQRAAFPLMTEHKGVANTKFLKEAPGIKLESLLALLETQKSLG